MNFTRAALEEEGFTGWVTFNALLSSSLPDAPGVYLVYRQSPASPVFLPTSQAGRFKGRDPSVESSLLDSKWVMNANVVYVGKATSLRKRLRQYGQFGSGNPVGHWGGRFIWQLQDHEDLLVAWKPVAGPGLEEGRLLRRFLEEYGRLPFANVVAGQAEPNIPSRPSPPSGIAAGNLFEQPAPIVRETSRLFVIANQEVLLSQDAVVNAMRGVTPEPVGVHGIRIDGKVFPVVQVLEKATGIPRVKTRSARARAVLRDLGFSLVEFR